NSGRYISAVRRSFRRKTRRRRAHSSKRFSIIAGWRRPPRSTRSHTSGGRVLTSSLPSATRRGASTSGSSRSGRAPIRRSRRSRRPAASTRGCRSRVFQMSSVHARAKDIFLDAVAIAAADRQAFVEQACAGNAALRREVESLLLYHDEESTNE